MCGIAGAVGLIDDRITAAVQAADAAHGHRGPDAHGYWDATGGADATGVAMAHRRLAILDLTEAGAQPMIDETSGTAIVFNGEVYNFREIRADLEKLGHAFRSDCDTEVVLKAFIAWGLACAERLRGMFAFAIWEPQRRQLHLVRDRLGIKPLYLMPVDQGRTILFASELRSLLATNLSTRTLDPTGLATYLWNGYVVGPHTIIDGVQLLPPGTHMTIDATDAFRHGEAQPAAYWRLPSADDRRTTVDELRHELETAVKLRMIADVPLGVFLSGGIDSSAVAALAVRSAGDAVHTFNIGFEQPEYDESPYAQQVAEALGTRHTCITLTEDTFRSHLDKALGAIDQPTFDGINTYFVSRAVREAGVTVALAGTGGDELFGGYRSFRDVPNAAGWSRRLAALPGPVVQAAASIATRIKTGRPGEVPPQTRWGKLGDALATRGDMLGTFQVSYSLFTRRFLRELSVERANGHLTRYGLPPQRADELAAAAGSNPVLHAISMLELTCFIGERLMRDTDAASMAVALEARVPLLDHRVVEAAAGLDENRRFHPLGRKQMLRDLALSDLDPTMFDRPKSGFVLPIDTWCRQGLNDQIDRTFHDTDAWQRIGIDPAAAAALWRSFNAGAPGLYWSRVWSLFVLSWWCQRYGVTAAASEPI